MSQLPIDLAPTNWGQFKFHDRQAQRLQRILQTGNYPYAMVFAGATGTGKTTAANLFIKSALCEHKQPGSIEPCGQCSFCRADPRTLSATSNVLWVQRGQDETLTTQFKAAIKEAGLPPYGTAERKIIVFDELQSIPKDRLQDLLFYPELPGLMTRNRVTFIFITMAEEMLNESIYKPLRDRSRYFRFRKLSDSEIESFLAEKYPDAPPESLEIIAHWADGSLRSALSGLQDCLEEDPRLGVRIVAETLYYVSAKDRQTLWDAMADYNYRYINDWWSDQLGRFDEQRLIQQMLRDLDRAMIRRATDQQLHAFRLIYSYLSSPAKVRALDLIKTLVGMDLVPPRDWSDSLEQSGLERIKDLVREQT